MVWIAHGVYLIVFVVMLFKAPRSVDTVEAFQALPISEKRAIYRSPWLFMLLVLVFPFLDCFVLTSSTEAFLARLWPELITAGFFLVMLFFRTKPGSSLKKLQWLPYVAFFLYTLIKNIRTHDNLIWILLAEALSLLTLAVFAAVSLVVVPCPYNLPTAAEKEVEDAKMRAEFQERKRREAEELEKLRAENRANEQARLQAEKDRRTHEAYERIVLGKKPSSSYGASYGSSGSSYDYSDRRERVGASGISCCDNCRYYDGSCCTCRESLSYNETILTARAYVCGYHKDR